MRSTLISSHPSRTFQAVSQPLGRKVTNYIAGAVSLTTLCALPLLTAPPLQAQAPAPPSIGLPSPANNYGADVARNSMMTPRFEIEFQDIPVTDLLIQIAKLGNVEIAIRGDVGGNMKIVRYKNVTAEEAVERVASDAGLFWGKRADQYVVARILEDLPYEMQLKYRNAAQSGNSGINTGGNVGSSSVPRGFEPPPVGGFEDFPPPPGGIALQGGPNGTVRRPNMDNVTGIPELYRPEDAKKRNISTNVIKIKNVTARMMAYWIDPANNAPDFITERSNQAKADAVDNRTLRPVGTLENFGLLNSASGRGSSYPGAYPYPSQYPAQPQQYGYPAGPSYGMPYNTASPYVIGNSNGRPIYSGAPSQNSGRNSNTDFIPGIMNMDPESPFVKQLLRQNNPWSNKIFNSNLWGQTPMIQARPQFGGRQGGRGQQGGGIGGGGIGGGGGQQQNVGVFDLPTGIDSMVAIDAQNVLLVRGTAEAVEELQQLIDLIDQPLKQVEIEAQFVTLTNSNAKFFGLDFSGSALPFTISSTTNPGGVTGNTNLGIVNRNFQITLNNLVTQAKAKIVTAPRVVAINNLTASLQSQTITTILLPQSAINAGGNGNNIVATAQVPFQIQTSIGLTVTPTINGDGTITVLMQPQVQQQGTPTPSNPVPTVSSQFINTVAIVRDGDTIALGGLRNKSIQNTQNKIPFLSNLPIIGKLFKSLDKSERDEDLIIFLTARVLHRLDDSQAIPGT